MTESEAKEKGYVVIKGYENHYMVNRNGNIFSIKRNKIMKPCKSPNGYLQIHLTKNGKMRSYKIHRLVAEAFIPNPNNLPQVNHKDEDKTNNFVDNLEWCTQSYNLNYNNGQKQRALHRNYDDISKKRSDVQSKEITQYDYDGRVIAIWKNAYIASEHGYNRTMINQCCLGNKKSHRGYLWKYSNIIEKQIARKPVCIEDKMWCCPVCYNHLLPKWIKYPTELMPKTEGLPHCMSCGQRIDWSE